MPAFHATEVDRLAQLVRASGLVLGDRLDLVSASAAPVLQEVAAVRSLSPTGPLSPELAAALDNQV